jgi:pectate lyase
LVLAVSALMFPGLACIDLDEPTESTFTPDATVSYRIIGAQSDKCLTLPASDSASAVAGGLEIHICDGSLRQTFRIEPVGENRHRLHNLGADLCLDVQGASRIDGASIIGWPCGSGKNQQWRLFGTSANALRFVVRHSRKAMDVAGSSVSDGTNLVQWAPLEQSSQRYRLQVLPTAGNPPAGGAGSQDVVTGWASVGWPIAGEGDPRVTSVTTAAALGKALAAPTAGVVRIEGTISASVSVGSNTTLEGAPGAVLRGNLKIARASNVVIRNLAIVAVAGAAGATRAVTIKDGAHHVWIDHCDLSDSGTPDLEIDPGTDNITVSWTKLSQLEIGGGRRNLRVTLHHNWWTGKVGEAVPRLLVGTVHLYDNYFDSHPNRSGIEASAQASLLLQNNYFQGASRLQQNQSEGSAAVAAESRPPYAYQLDDSAAVPALVAKGVGPH